MFLTHHFTFPLAIGTFVGSGVKDVAIAAKQLAVVQYQDASNFNVHSIDDPLQLSEEAMLERVQSVPNQRRPTSNF
jgi:hypothetical protein